MDCKIDKNETIDDLQLDGLKLIQRNDLYRFTSDSVILSNFVNVKPNEVMVDLGTGSGIVLILAAYKNKVKRAFGIEIQQALYELAAKNIEINKLDKNLKVFNLDMKRLQQRDVREELGIKDVDVVVSNPPYKKEGNQRLNKNESLKIARHEVLLDMDSLVRTVYSILKFGGKFYVVYDCDRLAELFYTLKFYNIEPKRMFLTQPSPDSKPILAFVEAVKGGKEGLQILPNVITNDKDGSYLQNVRNMGFDER